jgi:hypothetical protein
MKEVKNLNMLVSIVEVNIPVFQVCVQVLAQKTQAQNITVLQCKRY